MPINPNIIMQAGQGVTPIRRQDPYKEAAFGMQIQNQQAKQNALKDKAKKDADKQRAQQMYGQLGAVQSPEEYAQVYAQELESNPEAQGRMPPPEKWTPEVNEKIRGLLKSHFLDGGSLIADEANTRNFDATQKHRDRQLEQGDRRIDLSSKNADRSYELSVRNANDTRAYRKAVLAAKQAPKAAPIPKISDVSSLRKEYFAQSKDFIKMRDAFGKIESSGRAQTPAGDMALIFNFMKMLDPGSTVREGEYASAQNATNVPGQVLNAYNAALDGTKLNPSQRADFVAQSKSIFSAQERNQEKLARQFKSLAERLKINPDDVVMDLAADPAPDPDEIEVGSIVDGYRYIGGDKASESSWEIAQ